MNSFTGKFKIVVSINLAVDQNIAGLDNLIRYTPTTNI